MAKTQNGWSLKDCFWWLYSSHHQHNRGVKVMSSNPIKILYKHLEKGSFSNSLILLLGLTLIELLMRTPKESKEAISVELVIGVLLLAPIIETLLFQFIPSYLRNNFLRRGRFVTIAVFILSSILFSLTHSEDLIRFCFSFLKGLVLIYFFYQNYSFPKRAFLQTTLLHATYNGSILLLIIVFG
jgi:hypothetical protein